MKITPNKITKIRYEKATNLGSGSVGEITERVIVPTFVPQPNIKALDVSDLNEEEQEYIQNAYAEYTEYYATAMKNISSFENWLEMAKMDTSSSSKLKWRTFRQDNITLLD